MKKQVITLLFLGALPLLVLAQNNEGVIVYEQKTNNHRFIPEEMKANVPEFTTNSSELYFAGQVTLYKPKKEDQPVETATAEGPGGMMRMMMGRRRDNTVVYRDLANQKQVEETVFMDKPFLVEGVDKPLNWKVTGKQKMIAGYPCISASFQDSAMGRPRDITAWFTPAIPISSGPAQFAGLPGLILEVDMNQGFMVYTAKSVEMKKLDAGVMVEPEKGKRVTREEYRKIVDERMKEMREMGGGRPGGPGGQMIIIRN